jgi:hypothetical protein
MTVPNWLLVTICTLETGLLVAFLLRRQWTDVVYWSGVLLINAALLLRQR